MDSPWLLAPAPGARVVSSLVRWFAGSLGPAAAGVTSAGIGCGPGRDPVERGPLLDGELRAVAGQLDAAGASEMAGHHQRTVVGGPAEDRQAGGPGDRRVLVEGAAAVRLEELHRNVHRVAGEHRPVGTTVQLDQGGPRRVPGSELEAQAGVDDVAVFPKHRLPGLMNGLDAVDEIAVIALPQDPGHVAVSRIPEVEVDLRHQVPGVREGRNPLPVL